jgi:predicted NACHT family NTPase
VLARHRQLVLLGDPGSGKSTLLRYLLLQLVQGSETFAAAFPEMAAIASIVPLYLPLAAFAEVVLSNAPGTRSLEAFLPVYLRDSYLGAYVNFIRIQLERGNLFLLFDGLDEIPDAALRMHVVRHIELFTQTHLANRFIVTSRIVGYKEAALSSEYQPYTLADFNEEQVKTFAQRWCPAYERWVKGSGESQDLEDAATKEAEKLFDATQCRPGVKRLAVNPLLLTILALIQRQGVELPSHRIELFDLCATTLLDTWVKARGQSIHLSKNELIKILRPLAFWMHQHPAVGNIPGEDLYAQIVHCQR